MPLHLTIPRLQILPPPEPVRVTIPQEHVDELIESMRALGQIVPLIVTPDYSSKAHTEAMEGLENVQDWFMSGGMFEIIDGHCRWLAAPDVPLEELACSVFVDVTEAKHAMMLHAGIVRQSFTAYEEGRQFIELGNKHGWSIEDLCRTFHRSEGYVNDRVSIAEGPEDLCQAVHAREINLSQAKQILRAKNDSLRIYLLDQAKVHGATARTLEVMRQNWEKENIFAATGQHPNTPANLARIDPPAERTCVWCRETGQEHDLRTIDVHWYHIKPLMAIVDQVGEHNVLRGHPAGAAG